MGPVIWLVTLAPSAHTRMQKRQPPLAHRSAVLDEFAWVFGVHGPGVAGKIVDTHRGEYGVLIAGACEQCTCGKETGGSRAVGVCCRLARSRSATTDTRNRVSRDPGVWFWSESACWVTVEASLAVRPLAV